MHRSKEMEIKLKENLVSLVKVIASSMNRNGNEVKR
jgi:hypothetical protein